MPSWPHPHTKFVEIAGRTRQGDPIQHNRTICSIVYVDLGEREWLAGIDGECKKAPVGARGGERPGCGDVRSRIVGEPREEQPTSK